MNIRKSLLILLPLALIATPAMADVKIFACEPEWAALAGELGGDKVDAYSATTPFQDPHFIQARPSLIARVPRDWLAARAAAFLGKRGRHAGQSGFSRSRTIRGASRRP